MKNEIAELKSRINRLEKDIEVKIGELIQEFTSETDIPICAVYFERIETTTLSDSTKQYTQGKVFVSIKL